MVQFTLWRPDGKGLSNLTSILFFSIRLIPAGIFIWEGKQLRASRLSILLSTVNPIAGGLISSIGDRGLTSLTDKALEFTINLKRSILEYFSFRENLGRAIKLLLLFATLEYCARAA